MAYKFALASISVVFVGSSISLIILALLHHEIQERHMELVMGSMAVLSALIVTPPKY
ncbi:MAG: hypothetical protein JGK10_19790 [Microcoleus sp. PH2017_13_LAR_U_A]|uniref:hypothetical protein n=1 Tax=unclassified Microcoleus TaxID=2642155 RepID=UPI001DFA4319|nr:MULTISPECIES: hypothetical protein [unclassified Microcoleus]MCC3473977.1 hypothetical protein [Microcoleus sp. PH2017_13_LAR_U_A]MCC3623927.1 hypothetical protein [Microcoleus sp. PH2017_36_ELK_O_B]